ncbi:MAG: FAD-binding oxidoreductase, partial [Gammaproteobacteria bacterium]|nr:FAD-binding oxidoreductase [Gammaproteobacteria bacterium]
MPSAFCRRRATDLLQPVVTHITADWDPHKAASRSDREAAWGALRELLGSEHLLTHPEAIAPYTQSTLARATIPLAVARPASADEVAGITRVAERFHLPLYPISRGKNWGYGDACAVTDGQVIVDLSRMNAIIEVDAQMAYAVIEPGVTQGQLSEYLREHGIPLWLDCTGAGPEASIVGNVLERGFGHTPYGNRFQNICSMQVVLSNGRVLETGFGHFSRAKTKNLFPTGLGPVLHGLFTQSNLGIVTRLGIWMMPTPECFEAFFCFVEQHE